MCVNIGIQFVLRIYFDRKTSNATNFVRKGLTQKFGKKNNPILILMDVAEKKIPKNEKKNDQKITEKKWLTSRLV